jgi:predicted transcriptional regulator
MEKEQLFLNLFNELEQYLRVTYSRGEYSYTGFVTKLYQIKKSRENMIINNNHNFELIKQAAQMRNIISHNNDVLVPSDKFLKEFSEVVKKITKPLIVRQIMTKYQDLKTVDLKSTIGNVVDLLKTSGFSTIPIIDKDELLGIFTEKSLYDYFSLKNAKTINKGMLIGEIMEAIDLNNHPRKYYDFISANTNIYDAYQLFNKDLKVRREMLLLLVTENGKEGEHLLGIIALRDLENQLIN